MQMPNSTSQVVSFNRLLNVNATANLSLTCTSDSFPAPALTWLVNDRPVPRQGTERYGPFKSSNAKLTSTSDLYLSGLQESDSGTYRCVVDNGLPADRRFSTNPYFRLRVVSADSGELLFKYNSHVYCNCTRAVRKLV